MVQCGHNRAPIQQSLKDQTTADVQIRPPEAGVHIVGTPLQQTDEHAQDKAAVDAIVPITMQHNAAAEGRDKVHAMSETVEASASMPVQASSSSCVA